MVKDFHFKDTYDCKDLVEIVTLLRGPGGCPWDAEQTHESIRKNFIEETYEVIEAINKNDKELLLEELGDVLLQVALHAEMEAEKKVFDFNDVCNGICQKLIVRHPHVFGEINVSSTDEVLSNWEAIKMKTKKQNTATESLLSVPREFPALMRAQKTQQRAAKAGFDWDSTEGAFQKVKEETSEVAEALSEGKQEHITEEIGDLLFAVVNVCRFAHVDAEEALTAATDKFTGRFAAVEALARARDIDMKNAPLSVLDGLWEEVKSGTLAE